MPQECLGSCSLIVPHNICSQPIATHLPLTHHPYHSPSFVPQMPRAKKAKAQTRHCSICQEDFHAQAFTSHFKKCQQMKKAEEGLEEYKCSIMEKWYSNPTSMCPFTSFFNMTDILFPVCSGFDNNNLNTDADYFGAPSSPGLDPPTQLETPLPQPILSTLIPFPTSHAQMTLRPTRSELSIILGARDLPRSATSTRSMVPPPNINVPLFLPGGPFSDCRRTSWLRRSSSSLVYLETSWTG